MSQQLIARSKDLLQLQNEGYDLKVLAGHLLIRDVPYVNANREVKYGILISTLCLSGNVTGRPDTHVAYWTGEHPFHSDGRKLVTISHPSGPQDLGNEIRADFTFSAKADYRDYHHKMTTYIGRITGEARVLDEEVTAQTFSVVCGGSVSKLT